MFVGRSENSVHVIVNNVQHIGIARTFCVPGSLINFSVPEGTQKIVCLRVAIGGSVPRLILVSLLLHHIVILM